MKFRKVFSVVLALSLIVLSTAHAAAWMDGYSQAVIADANAQRARYGLPALRVDAELMAAARVRAEEISRKFSHTRPNGQTGSSVTAAARNENIARGHKTPDKVMAAWLSSNSHRRNILAQGYGSVGVACLQVNGIYYWVQLFGK